MTDQTQDLQAMMAALLAQANAPKAPPPVSGWHQPSPPPDALIQGVGVPVKIGRGRGNLKITLWLPAECASSPATLNAALDQLEAAGIPLDVWEPKAEGWSSSGNSRGWRK